MKKLHPFTAVLILRILMTIAIGLLCVYFILCLDAYASTILTAFSMIALAMFFNATENIIS